MLKQTTSFEGDVPWIGNQPCLALLYFECMHSHKQGCYHESQRTDCHIVGCWPTDNNVNIHCPLIYLLPDQGSRCTQCQMEMFSVLDFSVSLCPTEDTEYLQQQSAISDPSYPGEILKPKRLCVRVFCYPWIYLSHYWRSLLVKWCYKWKIGM